MIQPSSGVAGVGAHFHPELDDLEFRLRPCHVCVTSFSWCTIDLAVDRSRPGQAAVARRPRPRDSTQPGLLAYTPNGRLSQGVQVASLGGLKMGTERHGTTMGPF